MKKIINKIVTKIKIFLIKNCLAGRFDENSVLLLTSSPRSGSTWLGNILGSIPDSCVLFEPLQLNHVPESKFAGFSWRTFVHHEEKWPEGEAYLRRVFEGRVVNEWTGREMHIREACRSKTMIIKFVRANRLLPWICNTFRIRPPIFLMRHPCAVISSQLNYEDWRNAERPAVPAYLKNYPFFQSVLSKTEGVEENLAASWALDQLPPLMLEAPQPWIIITYEELFLYPEITLTKIFQTWDLDVDMDKALSRIKVPSSVIHKSGISGLNGWKKKLTHRQASGIINTINDFGLHFYTQNLEPDYDVLNSKSLPQFIRKAGIG